MFSSGAGQNLIHQQIYYSFGGQVRGNHFE
jgi:hypothetical protein